MAANPSKVVASTSFDDKSGKKTQARAQAKQEFEKNIKIPALPAINFFTGLGADITKKMADFLNSYELAQFSKTVHFSYLTCKSDIEERKRVTEELLPHVFNANPEGIDEFFRKTNVHPKMLLTKSSYREGYFSKKLNKFICFRHWKGVDAWQAAYLCGDGPFLGHKLLAYIIRDNKLPPHEIKHLLAEAVQQLQELLNRIAVKSTANSGSTTNTAKNAAMMPSVSTTATVTLPASSASAANNNVNSKEKLEQGHIPAVNTENEFADSSEFLAPLKELINSYNTYIAQYGSLASHNKWDEITNLWEQIGECHKRLPQYVLQEFFGPIPFDPVPEFNTEPNRRECRNNHLSDLDELGIGTFCGLYKAAAECARRLRACGRAATRPLDLAAVNRLCELRAADLRNTFSCLQTLESALTLINNVKTLRIAL